MSDKLLIESGSFGPYLVSLDKSESEPKIGAGIFDDYKKSYAFKRQLTI